MISVKIRHYPAVLQAIVFHCDFVYQGGAKEFFQLDKRWYLLALVCHKDIFDRGCLRIFHHQCESYYKALVTGSSEMSLGCCFALPVFLLFGT